MTKESLILYWLATRSLVWAVQYIDDAIIYTVQGGLIIEYHWNEMNDNECTVLRNGKVELFGTVEYCLKHIKK